jgi:hypothetical protein
MKKILSFFIFTALLVVNLILLAQTVEANEVSTPTILQIGKKNTADNQESFFITGLTIPGTDVLVYLNGELSGHAKINSEKTAADNFYYSTYVSTSTNQLEIKIVARDIKSQTDSLPQIKTFIKDNISAPTIIFPSDNDQLVDSKIRVTGLSESDTSVNIIIDGKKVGQTAILSHQSGTASFSYKHNEIIKPGKHTIVLQAEDIFGNISENSQVLNVTISHPMPAPTLKKAVVNEKTNANQPFLTGLAKNNSLISFFIDNEYDGQFYVENHKSGTANFAYKPGKQLSRGLHTAYATATDFNGKESKLSNPIDFQVKTPMIAEAESTVEKNAIGKIIETENDFELLSDQRLNKNISEDKNIANSSDIRSEEANGSNQKIQNILEQKTGVNLGLVNEKNNRNTKINFNLVIFMAFLLGIIVWIIWVNKELVKEKQNEIKSDGQQETEEKK